jgi:DNA-directed RNA polymerase specialized sigma24 family protein
VRLSDYRPEEIVALLLATADDPRDHARNDMLAMLGEYLRAVARSKFPGLGDEADDLALLVLEVVARQERLASIKDRGRFWPWLHGVLIRKGKTALRTTRRRRARIILAPSHEKDSVAWIAALAGSGVPSAETIAHNRGTLRRAIDELRRTDVGRLRLLLDRDNETVAAELGCTPNAVASKVNYLRDKLRKLRGH